MRQTQRSFRFIYRARIQTTIALLTAALALGACSPKYATIEGTDLQRQINGDLALDPIDVDTTEGDIRLLLSLSGGGTRAANFGLGVMLALESLNIDSDVSASSTVFAEIDGISTVSGGGLGVALINSLTRGSCSTRPSGSIYSALRADQLAGHQKLDLLRKSWVNAGLASLDPRSWSRKVTSANLFERQYFQLLTQDGCDPNGGQLMLEDAQDQPGPIHVPNATISGNGRVLAFTEHEISRLGVDGYLDAITLDWKNLDKTGGTFASQLPYSVAIAASAAFPPVLMDTRLRSHQRGTNEKLYIHLTDGGQSDDNGIKTALRMINGILSRSDTQNDPDQRVIYIAVDALPDSGHIYTLNNTPAGRFNLVYRNQDLPRYGNKRELPDLIYRSARDRRSDIFDQLNAQIFAAHISLWSLPDKVQGNGKTIRNPAKIDTVTAGLFGLEESVQEQIIYDGMMLTFKSVVGLNAETDSYVSIADSARDSVRCLLSERHVDRCKNEADRHALTQQLSSFRRSRAESSNRETCRGCFVEFARSAKVASWERMVGSATESLDGARSTIEAVTALVASNTEFFRSSVNASIESRLDKKRATDFRELEFFENSLKASVKVYSDHGLKLNESYLVRLLEVNEALAAIEDIVRAVELDASEFEGFRCECDVDGSCELSDKGLSVVGIASGEPCRRLEIEESDTANSDTFNEVIAIPELEFVGDIVQLGRNVQEFYSETNRNRNQVTESMRTCRDRSQGLLDALEARGTIVAGSRTSEALRRAGVAKGNRGILNVCFGVIEKLHDWGSSGERVELELNEVKKKVDSFIEKEDEINRCGTEARSLVDKLHGEILNEIQSLRSDAIGTIGSVSKGLRVCPTALSGYLDGVSEGSGIVRCLTAAARAHAVHSDVRGISRPSLGNNGNEETIELGECKGGHVEGDWEKKVEFAYRARTEQLRSALTRLNSDILRKFNNDEAKHVLSCLTERRRLTLDDALGLGPHTSKNPCMLSLDRLIIEKAAELEM